MRENSPGQPGMTAAQIDVAAPFEDGLADIRKDRAGLRDLVAHMHRERGIDFSGYIESTLARRIAARVKARSAESFGGYKAVLDKDPEEYARLLDHLTITVTRFFRNKAALEALEKAVVSLRKAHPDRPVKIWCAGCATGQEPFSIAMLLDGQLGAVAKEGISILATDIDREALKFAREGLFGDELVKDVPAEALERYFDREAEAYRMKADVRDRIDFRHHNLLADPPPPALDMVVCRNVLIYFRIPVQTRLVRRFHHALNPGGLLLLGRYEMLVRDMRHGFRPADFEARLYRKRAG